MRRHEYRQARRRTPNYMPAMLAAGGALECGKVYRVRIEHDDCCAIWRGKPCNCTPIVRKPQEVRSGNPRNS